MNNNVKWVMVHHSAISYDKNPNQFEANNRVHKKWGVKSSLGFYLGYNYEISKCGIVRQARRDGERTVACWQQGMNNGKCIHLCLDGNFSIQFPTPQQEKSLTKLLKELKLKYPNIKIIYHRHIKATQCPGKLIADDWARNLILNNKTMFIRVEHDNKVYAVIGDSSLIHFNTDGKTFADTFANAIVVVISVKEFEKFDVITNVSIKK